MKPKRKKNEKKKETGQEEKKLSDPRFAFHPAVFGWRIAGRATFLDVVSHLEKDNELLISFISLIFLARPGRNA